MAKLLTWHDPTDIDPVPNAYLRWTGLIIEPASRSLRVTFRAWRDRRAHDASIRPMDPPIDYALTGGEFDAFLAAHPEVAALIEGLVYDFAMAQPELAGAVDAGA